MPNPCTRILFLTTGLADLCWNILTSSQDSNCDGVVFEVCFESQIPATAGGLELWTSYKYKVANSGTLNGPNLLGLMAYWAR